MKSNVIPTAVPSLFEIFKTRVTTYMMRRLDSFSSKGPDYASLLAIRQLHRGDSIIAIGLQLMPGKDKPGMCFVRFSVRSKYPAGFTRTSVMEYWVTYRSYVNLERSLRKKMAEAHPTTYIETPIIYPYCEDPNVSLLTAIWCANGCITRNIIDHIVTEPPLQRRAPGNGVDR